MQDVGEAWSRYARGDFQGACDLSEALLKRRPDDAAVVACRAMSMWELGAAVEQCLLDMRRAVELAPQDGWIWHNLGTVLASVGKLEEARASYSRAIELKPDDTQAFYGLSQNCKFTEETPLVRQMLELYAGGTLSQRGQEYVCFALAKIYGDLGRYARSIHFCTEANWVTQRPYDAPRAAADLDELRLMAREDRFRPIKAGAVGKGPRPVFVVGMPRSGTTLMETVLSRHPEVHAGGELFHIADVEQALLAWVREQHGYTGGPYEMLSQIPADFFTRNAAAVLKRVEAVAGGRSFSVFTDKLPENTQRLGLISKLFPQARIINMRRNALDCCISIYFLHFARGNGFAFQQTRLGERYRQVAETMQLWKRSIDLPILDVSYEALVTKPEQTIRRVIEFAGLDWNEACLSPQQATRRIATSNQWQVRQPINTDSIGRWRHYEEWIQPLIKALGGLEWIENEHRKASHLAA